ncbi:MAG: prolyl oligopeptidase family serine peptidase [Pirellulaceae bacterium]|nr:prolyl oligopeptidase family serine peptidase [Pirellulaceae bacterium]
MKFRLFSLFAVGMVATGLLTTLAHADQTAESATVKSTHDGVEKSTTIRYWLALPKSYAADDQKQWPLLLFLHGSGERGNSLDVVKKHGPPKLVAAGKELPFVVVSPQCPADARWNSAELAKLVEHLANTLRIDRRRLYVTGLSMGGSGTWSLLAEQPTLFAAAVPICGRGDAAAAEKIAQTPVWAFVGDKDRAELVENNRELAAALKKAGAKAELTVYPGIGHDSWTETYDNPKVYEWLLSHERAE